MRIFIVLIILLGLIFAFFRLPIFNVRSLEIKGNEKVETEAIIEASKVTEESNCIFLSKEKVEENIKSLSFIESATIKKRPFFKVVIEVQERKPASTIQVSGKYLLIDKYGYIIDESQTIILNLFLLKGIENVENIKIGDSIFNFATEKQNKLLTQVYNGENLFMFKSMTLEEDKAEMVLYNDVFVAFGSYENIEYKLQVLEQMIRKIEEDAGRNASMILMEEGPNPVLVYD